MKLFSLTRQFGSFRWSSTMWRSASSGTSSASVYQAKVLPSRHNAPSRNKRESPAPFTQPSTTPNSIQEQPDSGGPRRLDHDVVSFIISATFSLMLLYICFPFCVANRSDTAATLSSAADDDKLFRRRNAATAADGTLLLEPQVVTIP